MRPPRRYECHSNLFLYNRRSGSKPPSSSFQKRSLLERVSPASLKIFYVILPIYLPPVMCRLEVEKKESRANDGVYLYQELGIEDPDPPDEMVGVYAHIEVPAWATTRDIVTDVYFAKRNLGYDEFEGMLNGPCDSCPLPSGAVCEQRKPEKKLWEL